MFFNVLFGRGMAAAEDEETVGGDTPQDVAAAHGDATARSNGLDDDVNEAGNGGTDTAVRVEDVLLNLTREEYEEDAALQASFSGISEEDRQVLMQFLPQLEHLKNDGNTKDLAGKDPFSNINSQPSSTNGFADQEPSLVTQTQPPSTNGLAEQEPSSETKPLSHVGHVTEQDDSPEASQQKPLSHVDHITEQEDSPEASQQKPLSHVGHLTEQEDSPQANPQAPSSNSKHEDKGKQNEESAKFDEIMKELKSIKRQQTITHCLVSVLIVVTAVWQFSEASMLLNVKDKISHPFRAIGGFFSRALLGGEKMRILNNMPSPDIVPPLEVSQLSHIKLPELPSVVIESIED